MRTLRPMTRRAAGVATLLSAALTLMLGLTGGADANPSNGMIDGNYAARMPAYYLHKTLRAGVNRVCVQITSSGANLTGTVKTQAHGGTWTLRRTVSLTADSGAHRVGRFNRGDNRWIPPGGGWGDLRLFQLGESGQ